MSTERIEYRNPDGSTQYVEEVVKIRLPYWFRLMREDDTPTTNEEACYRTSCHFPKAIGCEFPDNFSCDYKQHPELTERWNTIRTRINMVEDALKRIFAGPKPPPSDVTH